MNFADSITNINAKLTFTEEKTADLLLSKIDKLVKRDEIAQALWGSRWLEKYSEYMIDKTIYRLRKKLTDSYKIVTLKKRGYVLTHKLNKINLTNFFPIVHPKGIYPHHQYLEYMNNPKNTRKTLKDLFSSVKKNQIGLHLKEEPLSILVINSYSQDNIDSVIKFLKERKQKDTIIFSHFDDRALKFHQRRVFDLGLDHFEVVFDDVRKTRLTPKSFDLIINDFRLNFNTDDKQNIASMTNSQKLLKPGGFLLISVVVDARYESSRYGHDQEKAPINNNAPFTFKFTENLERYCYTVPYYKKLFKKSGFKIVSEFDIKEGKTWFTKEKFIPNHEPTYRRFLLRSRD